MAAVPASAQPSDQRLPDKAAALVQHFPCRAHGLGLKNEAGALPGLTQPWGALRKEGVMVPPHKPGHSRTQLWTRRGGKPLPRLPVSPWVQVLLVATWAWAGVALKGPHSPGQGPGPAWQALSSVPGGASSPHGGARARPGSCPCQARPGRGQSVRRARREWRHVWCVHTRERLHTHTAVRSAGSHGNRAAAGEGAPLPVPWERSPRAPALSGTLSACSTAGRGAGAALANTQMSGGGQPGLGPAGRGRVALRLKDGNQNNRKADEIGCVVNPGCQHGGGVGQSKCKATLEPGPGRSAEARTSPT